MGYLEICCLYFKYLVIFFRALSIFDLFNIIFAGKCALYELMFLTSRFKKNFRCKTFYIPDIIWDILFKGFMYIDGMGREEGGGFRMGNTCIPVADSFWYLAKLIQLCKV